MTKRACGVPPYTAIWNVAKITLEITIAITGLFVKDSAKLWMKPLKNVSSLTPIKTLNRAAGIVTDVKESFDAIFDNITPANPAKTKGKNDFSYFISVHLAPTVMNIKKSPLIKSPADMMFFTAIAISASTAVEPK